MSEDEWVLALAMHHIVSDGWSMAILIDEVTRLYSVFRGGGVDTLPPLRVQYADYAVWQRKRVAEAGWGRETEYWARTLAGAPAVLTLPRSEEHTSELQSL